MHYIKIKKKNVSIFSFDVLEPAECEASYAAACMGNYIVRLLTHSFAPLDGKQAVCW